MTRRSWMVMVFGLALGLASSVQAQNSNSGDIRGTVTDSSGAVVPGVNVTVTNNDTGVVNEYVTNSSGLYDTNSILPGNYTVQFRKGGFDSYKIGPVTLQVGVISVDGVLKVGAATEVVQVNASDRPMLKTEDAEVETTLSLNELSELPNVNPSNGYVELLKLLPGATGVTSGNTSGGGGTNSDAGFDQAINGTMPYFSSYLVDGGSIWLPHSANTDQGVSESVSEVNIIASDATSQYGGGGSVFNVILKSGTDQFHGSAYDYIQNDDLDARSYFNTGAKGKVRYNYFGGAVGGPIVKNKMFFYYNFQTLKNPNSGFSTATEPTAAMEAGCFNPALFGNALKLDAAHGGTALTTNPVQCAAFEPATDLAIPTADFDPVAKAIQSNYFLAGQDGNSVLSNNYTFLAPGNGDLTKQIGRLDYNITPKNRLDFSIIERYTPVVVSTGSPNCPVNCNNNSSDGGNGQLSDVWSISPNVVNEARFSFNREADYFAQQSLGEGTVAKIGLQFSTADVLPSINISGTGGNGTIQPGTEALFIQNTFAPSDTLTWIKGKNVLHFGGELLIEQDDSTPWGGINGATLGFSGQFTTSNTAVSETGYADFLLGDVQSWNTNSTPKHYMRANNPSFFAQDDIKIRPNLTINLGVRSETHEGSTEKYNNAGGFDPTLADPLGSSYTTGGTTYPLNSQGSIWFAGLNGERTKSYATKTIVMPRAGFAWQPTDKWVVRGGVGQYGSLWSEDTVGGPMGFGSGAIGSSSVAPSATVPVVQLSGSGSNLVILKGAAARDPLSYVTPANPQGSGGSIPYTPYELPIQNGWQWMVGVQRTLPGNMVAEAEYVGSHWGNMMFLADDNQLPAGELGMGQAARPYPQFSGIGVGSGGSRTGTYNGISNYQAASVTLHKPMRYGVALDAAYTWSRLKDDMDDSGWGEQFGDAYYQDAYNPKANYAVSNLNRPNVLKGTLLYAVPLGKGHQFLSSAIGDAVLGGWTVSGDYIAESGAPFTVTLDDPANNGSLGPSDDNSEAAWYPNLTGNPGSGGNIQSWFNQQAYSQPATNTFGTNQRNSLTGPDLVWFDFSLAKSLSFPGWERGKLQIRMDANNIFNHPAFADPYSVLNPGALISTSNPNPAPDPSVGRITGTDGGGRTIQLSARFSF
jgi:Carboxypeptidase regulatory-like domain